MVKLKKLLILTVILIICLPFIIYAEENRVYDGSKFFSKDEQEEFNNSLNNIKEKYGLDFILVTTNNAKGKSAKDYADDFFDKVYKKDHDGGILLIDMDNREIRVSTSGKAIDYLTDYRQEEILNAAFPDIKAGNYVGTAQKLISKAEDFLSQGIPVNQHRVPVEKEKKLSLFDFLTGIGAGGAVSGSYFFANKKRYKGSPKENTFYFRKNSFLNFSDTTDRLVDTNVTSRLIPVQNSSSDSGKSSTYTSSSGGTKSSSGKKF